MDDTEIDIYTKLERQGNNHVWFQECKGEKIPGTDGISPVDVSPFIVLRWTQTDTNYGTSYVNEYKGDLITLEALTQAIAPGVKDMFAWDGKGRQKHDIVRLPQDLTHKTLNEAQANLDRFDKKKGGPFIYE